MNHEEIKEAIAAFCLGALDEAEQQIVAAHVQDGCRECATILAEMREVVEALPISAPAKLPPPRLKANILAALGETVDSRPARIPIALADTLDDKTHDLIAGIKARWVRLTWGVALAAAVLVALLGWRAYSLQNEVATLENRIAINNTLVDKLRTELASKERILKVVQSAEVRYVQLDGLEAAPGASGKVFWNPGENAAVFAAANLPQAPAEKDYQLWMLRGNQPVDAGVVSVDEEGHTLVTLNTIADGENLTAFALTLEPKGGVPQPTGAMYLLGVVPKG